MYTTLNEWLDENTHRQFPLTDNASGVSTLSDYQLPQNLIVDILLNVPGIADNNMFYVSKVVVNSYTIDITISYDMGNVIFAVGSFTGIGKSNAVNREYSFTGKQFSDETLKPFGDITGTIIIGNTEQTFEDPGEWPFDRTSTNIISTCISTGVTGVRRLIVNDTAMHGSITLKEGNNVTFDYTQEEGEHIITINATDHIETGSSLNSDSDVMDALIARFGAPVTSINNISPDVNGNFKLNGIDCTNVKGTNNGLTIDNPCANPCCDKEIHLSDVYNSINALNARYSLLLDHFLSVSQGINGLQNHLGILQLNVEQQ